MENKQFTPKVEPPKTPEKKTEFFDFSPEQKTRMTKEFFGVTDQELLNFKERIAKNEGHVRIFVHPFYVSAHPESYARRSEIHGYDDISQEEAAKHLEEGFLKTVRSVADNKDSAPLIIFEEESQIEETRKAILEKLQRESLNFAESGIIFSPTEQGRGAPHRKQIVSVYENVREPAERSEVFYEAAQKIYEEILSTLEIQSGTMGGAYFDDWYRPGDELGACAGNVRKTFNHLNIPINLSRYTISPREQLKKHYPTKQTREKDSQ